MSEALNGDFVPAAPAAIVLAAGAGRRMGGRPKALLLRDGETLLARQLRMLRAAGVPRVVVVLGHHAPAIEAALRPLVAELGLPQGALGWVRNPAPDLGPGSSLRAGLAALPEGGDVLVALADQPLLAPPDVVTLLQAWRGRRAGCELLVPMHAGTPGHPVVFSPAVRVAVQRLGGGEGVREWRRAHPAQVQWLVVDHARFTCDVDTPEAMLALARRHGVALRWPGGV